MQAASFKAHAVSIQDRIAQKTLIAYHSVACNRVTIVTIAATHVVMILVTVWVVQELVVQVDLIVQVDLVVQVEMKQLKLSRQLHLAPFSFAAVAADWKWGKLLGQWNAPLLGRKISVAQQKFSLVRWLAGPLLSTGVQVADTKKAKHRPTDG